MSLPPALVPEISIDALVAHYDVLLLDAYGVLVEASRALPGAAELITALDRRGVPHLVVTNDASRSARTCAERYQSLGIPVPESRVITSGMLIEGYFRKKQLRGAECIVLGTEDSREYVRQAGGIVVPLEKYDSRSIRCVVICDEHGFPFLDHVDEALSVIVQKLDRGEPIELVVPNPDLIYPKSPGRFGVASGSIALVIEAALALRYPHGARPVFERLGKPHAPIFEEAMARAGTRRAVMIGDQLETDIRGANAAGLHSALVTFGVTQDARADLAPEVRPTWVLRSLATSP
ncbi:HAD-IIA family hydrolase [Myxococcota bacterium]|nr:HAD-IIA family hydrolase [Myxococcota bacterium]